MNITRQSSIDVLKVIITEAERDQAREIASLIMMAMTDECCLNFCGEGYGLADFHSLITTLAEREDSQYSYRNTLVALDGEQVVGIAVSYDGGRLHELRRPFIAMAPEYIGKDHSGINDETQAGELYLDSLAVKPEYRRRGIARRLINATQQRATRLGLFRVGLLVDCGNDDGLALYRSCGFVHIDDNTWGGHSMKHLIWDKGTVLLSQKFQ